MSTNQLLAYPTIVPIYTNPAYGRCMSRARDITCNVVVVVQCDMLADGAILPRKLAIHAKAAYRSAELPLLWYVYLHGILKRINDVNRNYQLQKVYQVHSLAQEICLTFAANEQARLKHSGTYLQPRANDRYGQPPEHLMARRHHDRPTLRLVEQIKPCFATAVSVTGIRSPFEAKHHGRRLSSNNDKALSTRHFYFRSRSMLLHCKCWPFWRS